MGKQSRKKNGRSTEYLRLVGEPIPDAILYGAHLLISEALKTGEMQINLPRNSYHRIDFFAINGKQVEVGRIGSARPINSKSIKQLFELASSFALNGSVESASYDPKSKRLKPVTIKTHDHGVDSYLIYISNGMAKYTHRGSMFNPQSFTTGTSLLSEGEPSVSFVTADSAGGLAERAMSTATEIMQNRCIVEGVIFERGKTYTDTQAVNPFQETLANGVGNATGSVMMGWTYDRYLEFLDMYDRTVHLWQGSTTSLLGKAKQFIAPHLMLGETSYEQISDGETPSELEIIPRRILES